MIDLAGALDRDETFLDITRDLSGLPLASIAEAPTARQIEQDGPSWIDQNGRMSKDYESLPESGEAFSKKWGRGCLPRPPKWGVTFALLDLLHHLHKLPGLLVLQSLGLKRLPEPLLSQ
jgi:hypothetical protein